MIEFAGFLIPLWLMVFMWVGVAGIFVISFIKFYCDSNEILKSSKEYLLKDKEADFNEK